MSLERPLWLLWLLLLHLVSPPFVNQYLLAYLKRTEVTGLAGLWASNMCICKKEKKDLFISLSYICAQKLNFLIIHHTTMLLIVYRIQINKQCNWLCFWIDWKMKAWKLGLVSYRKISFCHVWWNCHYIQRAVHETDNM